MTTNEQRSMMTMLMLAICDDDLEFGKLFKKALHKCFQKKGIPCKIQVFCDENSLMQALSNQYFDVICLDIEIGLSNGVEIGNNIRNIQKNYSSHIVFISSHDSYHHSGVLYDSTPIAFVKKPFRDSDIDKVVSKLISRVFPAPTKDDCFTFEYNRVKYRIPKSSIIYIECDKRQKVIYSTNGEFRVNLNMKDIIEHLDDPDFILTHRSFLVNINNIQRITSSEVMCKSGHKLPVSVSYYKDALRSVANKIAQKKQEEFFDA